MQTTYFKAASSWGSFFMMVLMFISCSKDPVPAPVPQPGNQELIVQFSNTGVALATIDSIVGIVRDQNKNIKLWKTLEKGTTSFKLNLQQLTAGNYTSEVLAYSKVKPDLTARQYALTTEFQLPFQQPLSLNAPTGSFSDAWYQRAVFFAPEAATIIIAMDPRDPFYEVRFKHPHYTRLHLDRSAINVNVLVAAKSKVRNIEGLLGFGEYGDFTPYVDAMKNKNWTKGTISGYVEPTTGGEIGFYYEYPNS